MNFSRIAPGYYTAGNFEIIRATTEYSTDWRLVQNGEWCQSFRTLADAKESANAIAEEQG